MAQFTFEYDTFYNYYADINNPNIYTTDVTESNVELHYYINGKLKTTTLSNRYIKVNGIDIYIKINPKNRDILFTTPHKIDDKIYDFHYHFGMRHEHIKCYFKQKSKITNTNNIICIDEKSKIMKTSGFSNEELNQIHEIILRPFMPHGGRKLKRRRHTKKNKKYNVIR